MNTNLVFRKVRNRVMLTLTGICTLIVLLPLFFILYYVVSHGVRALNMAFFTQLPAPPGESGGGMGNAILGTLELMAMAMIVGIPLGMAGGIYIAEFATERFTTVVRFCADVLNGIPTIVTGMFIYVLVVVPMKRFSAIAGALALAIILIPVVVRTTEEVLRTVPKSYREAALALGANRWRTTWDVVLKAGRAGLISGALLGVARIAGETAPLLFTSFNNAYWPRYIDQPTASLTVQIFDYAIAPYNSWHEQAWAGALTLIAIIISMNLIARIWVRMRERG
jgi:phosphate transport system permease protein